MKKFMNGGNAAFQSILDPFKFEEQLPDLRKKAAGFALRAESYGRQFNPDEVASAALVVLYARYRAGVDEHKKRFPGKVMTISPSRHAWRCAQAVRLSALGGNIGTSTPLAPDLAGRKRGYRPLKPWNAQPYAEHYGLPPCERTSDGIGAADLKAVRSPLARLRLAPREWAWITARDGGASHIEAARACGKHGSDKACESFSLRMAANIRRKAVAAGFAPDYDDGRGRSFAKPLPAATPKDEDDWRLAVLSGKINLSRGI